MLPRTRALCDQVLAAVYELQAATTQEVAVTVGREPGDVYQALQRLDRERLVLRSSVTGRVLWRPGQLREDMTELERALSGG